jgi:hypothetical protein
LDPATLPVNRKIALVAKAEGKSARLNIQVLQPNRPDRVALTGVGRMEGLSIHFGAPAESLYAPLRVDFPLGGLPQSVPVENTQFSPLSSSARVDLPPSIQGPPGRSSLDVNPSNALVAQTLAGHFLDFAAPLLDSIAPAVARAAWVPGPDGSFFLDLSPSEAVTLPGGADGLIFKRAGGEALYPPNLSARIEPLDSGRLRALALDPVRLDPRRIDSVSFTPGVLDRGGVAARYRFSPITPPRWGFGSADILELRLESNPVQSAPWLPWNSPVSLVLLDDQGLPVTPGGDALRVAQAGGPILRVRSTHPLDRLELSVYTNLGVFVSSGSYAFTPQEWDRLKSNAGSDTAMVRLLWHPSSRGAKLGTGAYLMQGSVTTRTVWEQDAAGAWLEKRPVRRTFGPLRFGFIRG